VNLTVTELQINGRKEKICNVRSSITKISFIFITIVYRITLDKNNTFLTPNWGKTKLGLGAKKN
jgi:hypothetical protein